VAGLGLLDVADFRKLYRYRTVEFWLGVATVATVAGVLVFGMLGGTDTYRSLERYPDARQVDGLVIQRFDAPLFFANSNWFRDQVLKAVARAEPPATELLIDGEVISDLDTTAVQAFDQLLDDLQTADVAVSMARVRHPVRDMMERSGLLERVGESNIHLEVDHAVAAHLGRRPPGNDGLPH